MAVDPTSSLHCTSIQASDRRRFATLIRFATGEAVTSGLPNLTALGAAIGRCAHVVSTSWAQTGANPARGPTRHEFYLVHGKSDRWDKENGARYYSAWPFEQSKQHRRAHREGIGYEESHR